MTTKTFSRARVAKAALKAIVDTHEVAVDIRAVECDGDRWTAHADIDASTMERELRLLLEVDIMEAGFGFTTTGFVDTVPAPLAPTILDMGEAGDATPYPTPAPPTDEELAAIGVVPAEGVAPKVTGYIAEASTTDLPTKRVWIIADSMPGAKRKDVIEACRLAGIAFGTARTQYQKWFSSKKN